MALLPEVSGVGPLRLVQVDSDSPVELLAPLRDLFEELEREEATGDPPPPLGWVRGQLTQGDVDKRCDFIAAFVPAAGGSQAGGPLSAVGVAEVEQSHLPEDRELVDCQVQVHPDWRRQGIGSELLRQVLATAPPHTTSILGWGVEAEPTVSFWTPLAGPLRYREDWNRARLADVDGDLMDRWIQRRADRAGDYRLVLWEKACPDQLLASYATARQSLDDAPLGDLEIAHPLWTPERVRRWEARADSQGFQLAVAAVVRESDGVVGGYTEAWPHRYRPTLATQGDTGVLREHRRLGLGRWIKAEMWRYLRSHYPEIEVIDTENADNNDAMLAINHAMGFRSHHTYAAWQAGVSEVTERLTRQ